MLRNLLSQKSGLILAAACFGIVLSASTAVAKTPNVLSIADCAGKPRLTQQLEDGQSVSVMVQLEEAGKPAMLVKEKSQESVMAASEAKGALVFQGVQGGNWMVCGKNNEQVAFNNVSVLKGTMETSSALKQGGIIGASVATVGAAAIGLSGGSSSSGSGDSAGRGAASAFDVTPDASSVATDDRAVIPGTTFDPDTDDDNFSFGDAAEPVSPFQ